ncbi:hypothetical protein [Microbispora sp. H10670]|uniref:hypothetical protein n=1 Tax=Microbispora sp. H10670 TaxID=2729108 RepID=UPI001602101C|nr:hypothetical protein [Microbispora sp. H10670]
MTEALINYVGEIPYRPGGAVELHPFVPCFEVTMGDEPLFKVWVQLSWEGSINAIRQLEGQGFPATAAEQLVSQALVLHGTRRLEQVVIEWLSTDTKPLNTSDVWNLTTDDVLHLLAPVRRKVCSNQQREPLRLSWRP